VLSPAFPPLADVLAAHDLTGIAEEPFPNDGWSGARLTSLTRGGRRFILKRDSPATDWIARATRDGPILREAWFAAAFPELPPPARAPYLGVGRDGDEFGLLMPDLSGVLFDWSKPIDLPQLDTVLEALHALHDVAVPEARLDRAPWCPLRERVLLISRPTLEHPGPARDAVADRILPGWDAFDRLAPRDARDLVTSLSVEPEPLLGALRRRRQRFLHGDLKLANAGIAADGRVDLVDWQMLMLGPVEVELGWFLASNVATLPLPADEVLARYDRAADLQLAWIVGLLLRGWRKGYDAEAGLVHPSGMSAADDLALWSRKAVAAARAL
jgi:phosphotransferase family enzyme